MEFSPAEVCDVRIESPRSSHSRLLAKPIRECVDEANGHHYEDPANLRDQVRAIQEEGKRPRKRYNDMYEPHIPLKDLGVNRAREVSVCSELSDTFTRESCINRCVLFFVFLTSVTALVLVVLIMLGKIGPVVGGCSCVHKEEGSQSKAESSIGAFSSSTDPTDTATLQAPPDVSSLENMIKDLRGNISSIRTYMDKLQQDIQRTKTDLGNTNKNISDTKTYVSRIETRTNSSIIEIQNIGQQLDASVGAMNVTFLQELSSVRTSFDSKLNSTAQTLLDADNSLQTLLNSINTSLSSKVQDISKLKGPRGPPGVNGSKGDSGLKGDRGQQGPKGVTGDKGEQGPKGNVGVKGVDGVPGQKGDLGPPGDKGQKGAIGDKGAPGPQGPRGAQGAGNFSQCLYKFKQGVGVSPGAEALVELVEQTDKKVLGATCSTNRAAEYNLKVERAPSGPNIGKYVFSCTCRGVSSLVSSTDNVFCHLHYWECPLTT
ncbi:scavenger receptor class A member 5-like isoform X3 [Acropora millepora]|uniref:scavenger receptor class A member 5-like isoform X3 n=1 Tax=Acropora millepora TaxID=45264 RepID=UPI001CF2F3E2|nr:scavenger receptor class A member 5-like isoform X3 [Acropora millepora]